jgi:hypothetical protein
MGFDNLTQDCPVLTSIGVDKLTQGRPVLTSMGFDNLTQDRPVLTSMGFDNLTQDWRSIPITEQAIGPLRRHTITGLTIRTSARLCRTPCKPTNDLECDAVQWQMRRSSRLRHQFETAVFNDIASACPSLRTSQLRSCGM